MTDVHDLTITLKVSAQLTDERVAELKEGLENGDASMFAIVMKNDPSIRVRAIKSQKSESLALASGYFHIALVEQSYYENETYISLFVTPANGGSIYPRYDYTNDQPYVWTERLENVLYEIGACEETEVEWSLPVEDMEQAVALLAPYPDFVRDAEFEAQCKRSIG